MRIIAGSIGALSRVASFAIYILGGAYLYVYEMWLLYSLYGIFGIFAGLFFAPFVLVVVPFYVAFRYGNWQFLMLLFGVPIFAMLFGLLGNALLYISGFRDDVVWED